MTLRGRTLRGDARGMTTGAQRLTTMDELQLYFVGGGVVGGHLTHIGRTLRGDAR